MQGREERGERETRVGEEGRSRGRRIAGRGRRKLRRKNGNRGR